MRRLSIVIPVLDEVDRIGALLDTLQPARTRGAEVLVVDGGSRDATTEICAQRATRVLPALRGRARQLNAGAAAAHGDVLLFLHADCVPPRDIDREVLAALAERTLGWGRFDVAIDSDRPSLRLVACMMNWRSRATGIATGDQGIFVTRALFERIGAFPDQPLMEDIALSRMAKRYTRPTCLRARIQTSARRWETGGVMRTILLMWRLRLAYYFGADPRQLALRYAHVR